MAAGCVRRLLGLTTCGSGPGSWSPQLSLVRAAALCTAAGDPPEAPEAPGKKSKKQGPGAQPSFGSVGRRIPHRTVQLIGESGQDMGVMHRADVLKLLDLQGLKLVLLNASAEPPVYRLMSGRQIHEEQLKMREKQKERAGEGAGVLQQHRGARPGHQAEASGDLAGEDAPGPAHAPLRPPGPQGRPGLHPGRDAAAAGRGLRLRVAASSGARGQGCRLRAAATNQEGAGQEGEGEGEGGAPCWRGQHRQAAVTGAVAGAGAPCWLGQRGGEEQTLLRNSSSM